MTRDYRDLVIEELAASEAMLIAELDLVQSRNLWPQRVIRMLHEKDIEIVRLRREIARLRDELQRYTAATIATTEAAA
jgi:hypothetical protein